MENNRSNLKDSAVIIGFSARLPGCADLKTFWQLLLSQGDAIGQTPSNRQHFMQSHVGAYLDRLDEFDPGFFNIPPAEAHMMDPQQRLLLQEVWQALEISGLSLSSLQGSKTGVYVGVSGFDYAKMLARHAVDNAYLPLATAHSALANRISYYFDLCGPSEAIDTACSSSLSALDKAVHAITEGLIDKAIVCGVNLLMDDDFFRSFTQLGQLSPTGKCRPFDSQADGTVRGEGIVVVILQRQSLALAENNAIYARILASDVNHSGQSNTPNSPSAKSQEQLYERIYSTLDIHRLSYVEAHATGNPLGDRLEWEGWTHFIKDRKVNIKLGSVKSHIGHLEAASGLAGLIKILLMFQHKTIPGQAHFTDHPVLHTPSGLSICSQTQSWPSQDEPYCAAVSSFALGGVNVHVVLEQGPALLEERAAPSVFLRKKYWFKSTSNPLLYYGEQRPQSTEEEFLTPRSLYMILGDIEGVNEKLIHYLIDYLKASLIVVGPSRLQNASLSLVESYGDHLEFIHTDIRQEFQIELLIKYLSLKCTKVEAVFDLMTQHDGDISCEEEIKTQQLCLNFIRQLKQKLSLKSFIQFSFTNRLSNPENVDLDEMKVKQIFWELESKMTEEVWDALNEGLNSQYVRFSLRKPTASSPVPEANPSQAMGYQVIWVKKEVQPLDLRPYSVVLVLLNAWQQPWVKRLLASTDFHLPIYYVFMDDPQQFQESLNSLPDTMSPVIYYFAGMAQDELGFAELARIQQQTAKDFIALVNQLKQLSQPRVYLYSRQMNQTVSHLHGLAQALKKEHPDWLIGCIDMADEKGSSLAFTIDCDNQGQPLRIKDDVVWERQIHGIIQEEATSEPKPSHDEQHLESLLEYNQAIDELEDFCFHLVKHKLVSHGLIWCTSKSNFISPQALYADYLSDLIKQLKAFEKKYYAHSNKNQVKTWDNLLQVRLELTKKHPNLIPLLNVLAVCADQLVAILKGEKSIQDVLFPFSLRKSHEHKGNHRRNLEAIKAQHGKFIPHLFYASTLGLLSPNLGKEDNLENLILLDLGLDIQPWSEHLSQPKFWANGLSRVSL